MVTTVAGHGPAIADEEERPSLTAVEALLRERTGRVFLADERGNRVELPETAVRLIHRLVQALARGNPVEVETLPKEFTVQRAAEMLDLRPEDVVRLLDEGEIPAVRDSQDDDRRRIRFQDVLAYRPKRDADRRTAMDEMIRLSEEMGLYELETTPDQAKAISRHSKTPNRRDSPATS